MVFVVAVGISGCGGDASSTGDTVGGTSVLTMPQPSVPSGTAPVLTVGQFDWSHPANWVPRDLHDIALYADGTLVRVDAYSPNSVSLIETTLPAEQVEEILRAADAAGLGTATALPTEPSPSEIIDGGWTIVTRRIDSGIGTVIADQLCTDRDAPGSPRREQLCELLDLIPRRNQGGWREVPIQTWAVESAGPLPDLSSVPWPWSDLDAASLEWDFNDAGVRCAIVTDPDWPYTPDELSNYPALLDGVFRRPLLPHESTCTDVFSWRTTLAMTEAMTLWPASLTPNN